jgi:ABC-type antimicrobial peptide transport system permease subunit
MKKITFIFVVFSLFFSSFIFSLSLKEYIVYNSISSIEEVKKDISYFSSLTSRIPGYPGNEKAALYIIEKLKKLKIKFITEECSITVPYEEESYLIIGDKKIRIYVCWPNSVYTSATPKNGLTAPLVYVENTSLGELSGIEIKNKFVLTPFSNDFLNLAKLGAKGVIFIEKSPILRSEGEAKFLSVPLPFPRYFIKKKDAENVKNYKGLAKIISNTYWKEVKTKNIIGIIEGRDEKLKKEVIILNSFYDSISCIPSISPGADQASGISLLLQIAKILKNYPPKRTVIFLINSGHFQALSGINNFLSSHFEEFERKKLKIVLFISLDISSRGKQIGIFFKGKFYDQNDDKARVRKFFSDFATDCRNISEKIREICKTEEIVFLDGINPMEKEVNLPGDFAFDHEPVTLAGGPGVGFVTCDDFRIFWDTPSDTEEKVNFKNLESQLKFLSYFIPLICNQENIRFPQVRGFKRGQFSFGYSKLGGRVVEFDAKINYIPDKPIPGALVLIRHPRKTLMGVRCLRIKTAKEDGRFIFDGLKPLTASFEKRPHLIEGYKIDEKGNIVYAVDRGISGAGSYPVEIPIVAPYQECLVVIFPAKVYGIYDLIDSQNFSLFKNVFIYDGETNSEPANYGYSFPFETEVQENVGVIFLNPNMKLKAIMGGELGSNRFLLLNSTKNKPEGIGYKLPEGEQNISETPFKAAKDIFLLNDLRIKKLNKHRIINKEINILHREAERIIYLAREKQKEKKYSEFFSLSRRALGYETVIYPQIKKIADDVVKGVLFYLAMLLPFCYFLERLIFSFKNLQKQLLGTGIIFLIFFITFRYVHPAFEITLNPSFVLLAFLILSLSLLVIFLIFGKFEEQIKRIRGEEIETHKADIGRLNIAAVAFSLGISNMRKRKGRTILTCITLILLTFTVLSFSSVVTGLRVNIIPVEGKALYNGIMIRTGTWEPPISSETFEHLSDEFSKKGIVVSRLWYLVDLGKQKNEGRAIYIPILNPKNRLVYNIRGIQGLDYEEKFVTGVDKSIVVGEWFSKKEESECIVPLRLASFLKISPGDKILYGGIEFKVKGIYDEKKYMKFLDLDREILTPVDWVVMKTELTKHERKTKEEALFTEYRHLHPEEIIVVSNSLLSKIGGVQRSVAVRFPDGKSARKALENLMKRISLNIYAGIDGKLYRFSSLLSTSLTGLSDLIIPILIAGLIVLNTMLSSVYERKKEIGTFSSLGLAPSHIATLFLTEASVYAIIGAISGYLIAQGIVKIIVSFNLLPGLYLNYSSLSAVASTSIVMGVVLLSSLYPARKASEIASPAIERSWKLPEPEGDKWEILLPFSVMKKEITGILKFIKEWAESFEEYSLGDLITENLEKNILSSPSGEILEISFKAWLAPFDLGVSQKVKIQFSPTDYEEIYEIKLFIERVSGEISSWKRTNRKFVSLLRNQFLLWRTLSPRIKEKYIKEEI